MVDDPNDCLIGGLPASITPCASYIVNVTSQNAVGHKFMTNFGLLIGHPIIDTYEQDSRCRNRFSQTSTTFVWRATEAAVGGTYKFYAMCGKINGPINVKTVTRTQSPTPFPPDCASIACFSPLGGACYAPTGAPTNVQPGTAVNKEGVHSEGTEVASSSAMLPWIVMLSMMYILQ
jgi:hypothetical protein